MAKETFRVDPGSGGGWSEASVAASEVTDGLPLAAEPADGADRYTVGALLGRGGMGAVHAARDSRLGRDVALKELRPELRSLVAAQARLAREAAITSRLDHPGIIAVHDVGTLPDGRPYYTMRLVRGASLAQVAAAAEGEAARRGLVRHLLAAAEAVAAAHDAGIVHRDLKPQNILVGAHGETAVVDWGLAHPTPTAQGRWADLPPAPALQGGTDGYMSPEQARGEPADPRQDVWSLGLCLAGVVGGPERQLPAELSAIVARATTPDLEERYPDAGAFAADLLAWFEGRRVAAHRYSRVELLRRTVRAYRLPLLIGAVGAFALSVAVGVGLWQTARSRDRALQAEGEARLALADLRLDGAVAAARAGARERAERLALLVLQQREDPLARGVFAAFGRSRRPELRSSTAGPPCGWSALSEDGGGLLCGQPGSVSWWVEGTERWRAALPAEGGVVHGDRGLVWDGRSEHTALALEDGRVVGSWPIVRADWVPQSAPRIVWFADGPLVGDSPPPSACREELKVAAVSSSGRLAALCSDGTLTLGDREVPVRQKIDTEIRGDSVASAVVWTPAGDLLVGSLRGRLYHLSGADGRVLGKADTPLGTLVRLRVSPDGQMVAMEGTLGGVGLWRLDPMGILAELPARNPRTFAFTPSGLRVYDGQLHDWRLPSLSPSVITAEVGLSDVHVRSDGAGVVMVGGSGWVSEADLRGGAVRRWTLGDRVMKAALYTDTGDLVVSGMGLPRLARREEGGGWRAFEGHRPLRRLARLPGGVLVGIDPDDGLYRWADPARAPEKLNAGRTFVDLEQDGAEAVVLDTNGQIERLRGAAALPLRLEPGARAVALRGERLAVLLADGVVLQEGAGTRRIEVPGASLIDVALSADGRQVAASDLDGYVRVWDWGSSALRVLLPGHTERVVGVEFLPDGDLVSASWDKSVRVWDLHQIETPVAGLARELDAAWGTASTATPEPTTRAEVK